MERYEVAGGFFVGVLAGVALMVVIDVTILIIERRRERKRHERRMGEM